MSDCFKRTGPEWIMVTEKPNVYTNREELTMIQNAPGSCLRELSYEQWCTFRLNCSDPVMSSLVTITDKGGNSLQAHKVDAEYFPPIGAYEDYDVHLNNIKGLKLRDDDVIIIGYGKSGTHWVWEVTGMLLASTTEYKKQIKENQFLDVKDTDTLDALTSPRILNTHFHFRFLPKELVQKKTKIIYLLRNPKDIAVSYYHHIMGMARDTYNASWTDFFQYFVEGPAWYGLWFDYVLDYEKTFADHPQLPVCTIVYEDMKEDPVSNTKRLSEFLGVSASSEFCRKVADACSFKKLRHADEHVKENYLKDIWKPGRGFYRKGEVGDWKNWFTVAQSEQFDAVYQEKMKNSKLKFRFE